MNHNTWTIPLDPSCWETTQSSHTTVAMSRKPMNCLKRSIQGPGLGTKRSHAGLIESST